MNYLYLILSLFFTQILFAEIKKEQCFNVDHTNNISIRERDQDGHNVCWGFLAAALIEEENCLYSPRLCGQSLSVFDSMRNDWPLGKKNELRDVEYAITFGLANGICLESDAPFAEGSGLFCQAKELLENRGVKCLTSKLESIFHEYKLKLNTKECESSLVLPVRDMIDYLNTIANISDLVILEEGESTLALINAKDKSEFLKNILIPNRCQNNRIISPARNGRLATTEMFVNPSPLHSTSVTYKLKKIKSILTNGRSLGLGICSKNLKQFINEGVSVHSNIPLDKKKCGNHGILAQGMRWNTINNRCEIKIINSWGEDTEINGWISAEEVISSSYMQIYIQ